MSIEIEAPQRARGMVHKLIAETAKGICAEEYEGFCHQSNAFYKKWPTLRGFVGHNWRLYVHVARALLAGMLGHPDVADDKKQEIHKALLLDGTINPRQMATPEKPRFFLGPT